ncbi:RNA recognition motif domain-containing protein [Cinnamomum micranthum f. kanehirae]|uniref:RNA recognition motif domain-containing protein n=1 Tax=Cinnamomum micranthum f. kanehirae TaxID=337451 RepID=A0A443NNJ0_9MAGN|nr:RNA recognition motif domain-containing protein [Cinnamomum micranthum f. kanehirae]
MSNTAVLRYFVGIQSPCSICPSTITEPWLCGECHQYRIPDTILRMRNCAFVDFKDAAIASQAQSQLNRLRFLGKVLSVERAGKALSDNKNRESEGQLAKDSSSSAASLLKGTPITGNVAKGNIPGSEPISEPIAPRLGVDYQFPPHLEYAYPPPDGNILTNIVNALIAVPRFYTQVVRTIIFAILQDDANNKDNSGLHSRKRTKREAIVGPAVDKSVPHEAVGVKPATLVPKEIPLIKKEKFCYAGFMLTFKRIKIAPKPMQSEVVDDDTTMEEVGEPAKEDLELKPYATPQEIEGGRLPPEEILSLPMFKLELRLS